MVGMASNFGDLIPHLGHVDSLSLFEDWLSETSDLRDVLTVRSQKFQNKAVLVDDLLDSQMVSV